MRRRTSIDTQSELFPRQAVPVDRGERVELVMVVVTATDKAWLLRRAGRKAPPQWIPRASATRGEGADADVFEMSRGHAADRGWL